MGPGPICSTSDHVLYVTYPPTSPPNELTESPLSDLTSSLTVQSGYFQRVWSTARSGGGLKLEGLPEPVRCLCSVPEIVPVPSEPHEPEVEDADRDRDRFPVRRLGPRGAR